MKAMLAVGVVLLLAAGLTVAQPGNDRGFDQLPQLNLTKEQESRLEQMRTDFQKESVRQNSEIRLARIDLRHLMDADEADREQIRSTMKELSDLEYAQQTARLDHMFAVRELLTPEQRAVFKEHRNSRGINPAGEKGRMFRRFGDGDGCSGCGGGRGRAPGLKWF